MATEYTWVVSQMECIPSLDGLNDVVTKIHWRRHATLTQNGSTYHADVYGDMVCPAPSETDFTAYPDLTFEQVCGWLDAGVDVPTYDAALDAQIEVQINPPIVRKPNPWDVV